MGANETVFVDSSTLGNNLHVYAGVVKLEVGNSFVDGFCIDPWHWSITGGQTYNIEPLALAPKDPTGAGATGMGTTAALKIEALWSKYFSADISNIDAAALQIKIWQIVDGAEPGGTFSLVSVDADSAAVYARLASMDTYLASSAHPPYASLLAVSGHGQDYVIASVPDSASTLGLLSVALITLVGLRHRGLRALL